MRCSDSRARRRERSETRARASPQRRVDARVARSLGPGGEAVPGNASRSQPAAEVHVAVATVLLDRQRLDEALKELKAAENQDDRRADIYTLQALAYTAADRDRRRGARVASCDRRSIPTTPRSLHALAALARARPAGRLVRAIGGSSACADRRRPRSEWLRRPRSCTVRANRSVAAGCWRRADLSSGALRRWLRGVAKRRLRRSRRQIPNRIRRRSDCGGRFTRTRARRAGDVDDSAGSTGCGDAGIASDRGRVAERFRGESPARRCVLDRRSDRGRASIICAPQSGSRPVMSAHASRWPRCLLAIADWPKRSGS